MLQKYKDYFDNFLKTTDGVFRPGVGVNMSIFPFAKGALVDIELKENEESKIIQRKTSSDLSEALSRTKIYNEQVCLNFKDKVVSGSWQVLISPGRYLIIKSDSETEWMETSPLKDFLALIKKIKEVYSNDK
jgi:hypothetical protein